MELSQNDLGTSEEREEDFNQLNDETFGELIQYDDDFPYEYSNIDDDDGYILDPYDANYTEEFVEKIKSDLNCLVLDEDEDITEEKNSMLSYRNKERVDWSNDRLPGLHDIWSSLNESNSTSLHKNEFSFNVERGVNNQFGKFDPSKSVMTLEELELQLIGGKGDKSFLKHNSTNHNPSNNHNPSINHNLLFDNQGLTLEEIERLFVKPDTSATTRINNTQGLNNKAGFIEGYYGLNNNSGLNKDYLELDAKSGLNNGFDEFNNKAETNRFYSGLNNRSGFNNHRPELFNPRLREPNPRFNIQHEYYPGLHNRAGLSRGLTNRLIGGNKYENKQMKQLGFDPNLNVNQFTNMNFNSVDIGNYQNRFNMQRMEGQVGNRPMVRLANNSLHLRNGHPVSFPQMPLNITQPNIAFQLPSNLQLQNFRNMGPPPSQYAFPSFPPHSNFTPQHPQMPYHQSAARSEPPMQFSANQAQAGHPGGQWEGSVAESGQDEYAGLMTDAEKSWIVKIQLMQLHTDNSLMDDYYYTTHMLNKKLKQQKENNLDQFTIIMPQLPKSDHRPYEPVKYEGALGKLTTSSLNKPRQVLDVSSSANTEEMPRQDVKKLKLTLKKIEKKYDLFLVIDDKEKQAAALPLEQKELILKERFCMINQLIVEMIENEDDFVSIMNVKKGLVLLCRLLTVAQKPQNFELLSKIISRLQLICKKENNLEVLPILLKTTIWTLQHLAPKDLLHIAENFTKLIKNAVFTNLNYSFHKVLYCYSLTILTQVGKIHSLDNNFLHNEAWTLFVSTSISMLRQVDTKQQDVLSKSKIIGIPSFAYELDVVLPYLRERVRPDDFKELEASVRTLALVLS